MKQPVRTCCGTGQRLPQAQLLRWVNVGGVPTPDPTRVLPGRGAYTLPSVAAVQAALKRKAFAQKLKTNQPPGGLEQLAQMLDNLRAKGHNAASTPQESAPQ